MAKNLRFLTALKSPYLRPNLPILPIWAKEDITCMSLWKNFNWGLTYFNQFILISSYSVSTCSPLISRDSSTELPMGRGSSTTEKYVQVVLANYLKSFDFFNSPFLHYRLVSC